MTAHSSTNIDRFWSDNRGNLTVPFALTLPVAVAVVAGGLNYSRSLSNLQAIQQAADAASLAATEAYGQGKVASITDAQNLAQKVFQSSAPASAVSGQTSFSTSLTDASSASGVTATVQYTGSVASLFSSVIGNQTIAIKSSSKYVATSTAAGGTSGFSYVWGDPHMVGANGYGGGPSGMTNVYMEMYQSNIQYGNYVDCPVTGQINVLSDSGIQINSTCFLWNNTAIALGEFYVTAGTHKINIPLPSTSNLAGYLVYDGVPYYPTANSYRTLIDDKKAGISLIVQASDPTNVWYNYGNFVTLTTPNYIFTWNWADFGSPQLNSFANHAGVCGAVTGLLGQTYGPLANVDSHGADFAVPTPWTVSPPFSSNCSQLAATKSGFAVLTN